MKLHQEVTLTISGADLRRLLTEAITGPFSSPFDGLRVWQVWQAEGDRFVVEMEPVPRVQAKALPVEQLVPKLSGREKAVVK